MNYYICPMCGNIVEKVTDSGKEISCCGKSMRMLTCGEFPELRAKHVPVAQYSDHQLEVKVGMVEHPMLEEHYIDFISITYADKTERKKLNPTGTPTATFDIGDYRGPIHIESYCNIHGLWCNDMIV